MIIPMLASLAAAEAGAGGEGEIPVDSSTPGGGRSIGDILLSPPYLILLALLGVSVVLNIVLAVVGAR